jgi:hypothetical protein
MRTFWIDVHILRRSKLGEGRANLFPPKTRDLQSHRLDVNKDDSVLLQEVIYGIILRESFRRCLWGRRATLKQIQ